MKTTFAEADLRIPSIREASVEIEKCRHYGFCTATCPTYVLLGDEKDSPRGRIDLIKEMLEQGGAPDADTVKHLDRCLSCMSCTTTCPTSIDYAKLIDVGREYIEENYKRPAPDRLLRTLIGKLLTSPRLFRLSMLGAALGRPFARLLGAKLGGMVAMTKQLTLGRSEYEGVPLVRPEGNVRHRVALLEGCVQKVVGTQINDATIRLLARHGCEIHMPPSIGCCGSLPLHIGKGDAAREFARRAVDAWHAAIVKDGVEAIIINASGCGTTVKDYGHILAEDADYAEKARVVAGHAFDIAEWLVKIGLRPTRQAAIRVAYHDPCSLQHAQRVIAQPRELLKQAGFEVVNIPERHLCCGSAGTYNMLQPDIARQLGERKGANVDRARADVLATGNIGCMTQIEQYAGTPIVHLVELLDWATGGTEPAALAHLIDQEGGR